MKWNCLCAQGDSPPVHTIVTHNVKHFNHIEDLNIEDWIDNVEPVKP